MPTENVTLLLLIDELRLTALIHSLVTTAISKYCFLWKFELLAPNLQIHVSHIVPWLAKCVMVGIIPEERCDMEANVIGWHLLVSMIRLLSSPPHPSAPFHPSLTLFSPYWLQPCAQRYIAIASYPASSTTGSLQLCLFFLVDCFFVALHSDFLWHWLHSIWFLFSCCRI